MWPRSHRRLASRRMVAAHGKEANMRIYLEVIVTIVGLLGAYVMLESLVA
jgi:hypothetical protein